MNSFISFKCINDHKKQWNDYDLTFCCFGLPNPRGELSLSEVKDLRLGDTL